MAKTKRRVQLGKFVEFESLTREAVEAVEARTRKVLMDFVPRLKERARDEVPVDEGDLQKSVGSGITRDGQLFVSAGGIGAEHAHLIEYGTVHSAPDPFLRRTVRKELPNIKAELTKRLGEPYVL